MDKFIYTQIGQVFNFKEKDSEEILSGMKAKIANMFFSLIELEIPVDESSLMLHDRKSDYFIARAIEVHLVYIKKYFLKHGYVLKRVKQGVFILNEIKK